MKKKLIIIIGLLILGAGLLAGYFAWSARNTAKSEAEYVLQDFSKVTSSRWYCENGYGKGIDNQTPWWEEIYLSEAPPEATARVILGHLKSKGYVADVTYVANSDDSYNKGKTFWEIEGRRTSFSVQARVSSKTLTLNNCFKGFSDMNESLDPEDYNSIIIIRFRDGA